MPDYSWKYDQGGKVRGGPEILTDQGSGAANWFGSILVNSATGGALYPVATTRAASASMIVLAAPRWVGFSHPTASLAPTFGVQSLVSGVGFILRSTTSTAVVSFWLDWQLLNPK